MAWTDYYLDQAATGANTGLNPTDAWESVAAAITGVGAGPASGSTRINWKVNASPYAQTTNNRTFNTAGATTAPVWWRGYQTTPGDMDLNNLAVANTNIPQLTFTTGQMVVSGTYQIFSNIDIASACIATYAGAVNVTGSHILLYGVRIQNSAANANSGAITLTVSNLQLVRCYLKSTTTATHCVHNPGSNDSLLAGCTITGGANGMDLAASRMTLFKIAFDSQSGDSLSLSTSSFVFINGCTFYAGSSTGNGINVTSTGTLTALNNYVEGYTSASKAGINNTSGTNTGNIIAIGNTFFNNTANYSGMGDFPPIFENGSLASSGLVAPASQNFTPNALLQAVGFPGPFELVSAYRGYLDGGAAQSQPGGGVPGRIMMVSGQSFACH